MLMRNTFVRFSGLVFLSISFVLGACGDPNGGGIGQTDSGEIAVSPSRVAFSQVNLGSTARESLMVINHSEDAPLTIYEMVLEERDGGSITALKLVDVPDGEFVIGPNDARTFEVEYAPTTDVFTAGQIRIRNSDPDNNPLTVLVDTLSVRPELEVQPSIVRFARSLPGNRHEQTVRLINIGSAPLVIHEPPSYSGGSDFHLTALDEGMFPLELAIFSADAADENPEEYILNLEVVYSPGGTNDDSGEILVISNDVRNPHPSNPARGLRRIDVEANADAACILVDDRTRNFGQVPVGGIGTDIVTITNCGSQALLVSSIAITEGQNRFELALGELDADGDGSLDRDLVLAPGQNQDFRIRFTPVQTGTERGTLVIASNDPVQPELVLDLVGRGSDGVCPVADARATIRGVSSRPLPNVSAVPLQYVILDATGSHDPDGTVVDYEWEVLERPPGTIVQLGPTQEDPSDTNMARREFRLYTAGQYKVGL
ncbi:MAG: choice-of-anchor D domain-containing protein, partial [Bradymonadaceae bacterium]